MLGIGLSHNLERAVSITTTTTHHHHHHLRINNTIMMLPNDRVKRSSLAATSDHLHRLRLTRRHRIITPNDTSSNAIHHLPLPLALMTLPAADVVKGTTRARGEAALQGVACPVSISLRNRSRSIEMTMSVDRSQSRDRAHDSPIDNSNIIVWCPHRWKLPKTAMLLPVHQWALLVRL